MNNSVDLAVIPPSKWWTELENVVVVISNSDKMLDEIIQCYCDSFNDKFVGKQDTVILRDTIEHFRTHFVRQANELIKMRGKSNLVVTEYDLPLPWE